MSFIKTPVKGTRDFLPNDMALREYVLKVMKDTYQNFGFLIMGTPALEHIENLTSKQGGENEKLIFKILKRGEKLDLANAKSVDDLVDSGLRYDLTVPLTRFYANNMNNLPSPFRAFQTGFVWRADRPQKGRFREFMQCDLDILGEKTNLAEIELITAVLSFLKKLDFKGFEIKINDRRILLQMILAAGLPLEKADSILISLDKMDKVGIDGVKKELLENGFLEEQVDAYLSLFNNKGSVREFCAEFQMAEDVILNLEEIIDTVASISDAKLVFDPTLVRGMSYYTGPIFEIKVDGFEASIGGGGRYDKMVEKYANIAVPAAGFSIGFERLLLLLNERNFVIPEEKKKKAYILTAQNKEVWEKAKAEREAGVIVKIAYRNKNYKFQRESLEKDGYEIIEW